MSKARYERGEQIISIAQFEASKSQWFKWRGKTTHRSWLMSLQYRTLKRVIDGGDLYEAKLKTKESEEWNTTMTKTAR
jgi:hypothetical protein